MNYKMMFLIMMVLGTALTFTSNNWWLAWLGMELNLLGFISFVSKYYNNESVFKYFMMQSLGSMMLLSSFISVDMNYFLFNSLMLIALLLKLGASPFHFWLPVMVEHFNSFQLFMMLTWQKIAPLMLIMSLTFNKLMFISLIFSLMMGSVGNINELRVFIMYTYSSISHTGWLMVSSMINEHVCMLYLIMYSIMLLTVMLYINKKFVSDHWYKLNLMYFLNMLSLGGLPPFTGFFMKWVIMKELINISSLLILSMLMITSMLLIYIYLRLTLMSFIKTNFKKLFIMNNKHNIFMTFMSMMNLPILLIIYCMFSMT